MRTATGTGRKIVWSLTIVVVSASLGLYVDWNASGLDRYARDWLVRARGTLTPPDDIAIVAIDEASIARFGRFPWSRQVMARTIDAIAAGQPKAIALDVLFTDPSNQEADETLARSIGRAGNVVVAAQLTESPVHGGPSRWLLPLPAIERAAAAVGHVNVQTEMEGVAREIEVQSADDAGHTIRAMAVEAVRVGDGTPEEGIQIGSRALLAGPRTIPLDSSAPPVVIAQTRGAPARMLRGGGMPIDFIGPAGSFAPDTYSLAEVVERRVPASRFQGKYVLIGATAADLGDNVASPFLHHADARADQHGAMMPGVEVLANAVDTILRARFVSETSDAAAFFWAALVALATLALLEVAQGGREIVKQLAALGAAAFLVILGSYLAFTELLVYPPLVPALVAFASAGMLGLLYRSLAASSRLDLNIAELAASSDLLATPAGRFRSSLEAIAPGWLPRGLEWKARTLGELHGRFLDRARFIDQALRSVEDGLIIATPEGRITFANPNAAAMLGSTPAALTGQNLLQRLHGAADGETLSLLVVDRTKIEREMVSRDVRPRHYMLRMAAVGGGEKGDGPVLGIVASLSDVTRQHELQQTKNDVISLVSHEMRTPLTAIQGMTELLADYDVDPARRREMHLAINDEVKRLTRMITEYLDITRLESGATELRLSPVKAEILVERILLLLDPVAARRDIRLVRGFASGLPALLADPDLLSRAVENLVSNAIKYSPGGTEVTVSVSSDESAVSIAVADHGYGVPEADRDRIFEKFYRIPRVQDAGVPGTGLGLAMVREIAGLHGGSVTVASEVGMGSTFTLRIPRGETATG